MYIKPKKPCGALGCFCPDTSHGYDVYNEQDELLWKYG